jgi:hypothetical protein
MLPPIDEGSARGPSRGRASSAATTSECSTGRDLDAVGDFFADERMIQGVRNGCFAYFQAFPDLHVSLDELIAEVTRNMEATAS